MHRTTNAFSVLQATAATLGIAIILWSVGLPSLRFAEAANVTDFSDTLSDSAPTNDSNHEIEFVSPTGVANGSSITIAFPTGFTGTSSIVATDIDVATTTTADFTVGAACGAVDISASFNGTNTLTLTMCVAGGESIPGGATTTIQIGTNASGGSNQINNPTTPGSYVIGLTAGAADTGETRVAIVNTVEVSASVDTLFTFNVTALASGQTINGTTTTSASTATTTPFETLTAGVPKTVGQNLAVITNAKNGFTVTVEVDGQLISANGADIDSFDDGSNQPTPIAWTAPSNTPGSENTYGHWGLTSTDMDYFSASSTYIAASTSPVAIFAHDGPANGTGDGATRVGYTAQIGSLQEGAEDYNATLTYVATPVF